MTLPLDYTSRTLEVRALTQGKQGFPAYVALNIFRTVMYTKFGVRIKNKRNEINYISA